MVNMNNVNNMKMWWWCCKYNQYWLDIMVMIIDDDSSLRPAKFEPAFLSSLGPRANTKNWRSPWLIWTILGPHMLKSETPTPSFCEFEALPVLLRDVLSPSFPSSFPFSSFLGSPSFLGLRCRNAEKSDDFSKTSLKDVTLRGHVTAWSGLSLGPPGPDRIGGRPSARETLTFWPSIFSPSIYFTASWRWDAEMHGLDSDFTKGH